MAASVVYKGAWQGQTFKGAWQNAVVAVAGSPSPRTHISGPLFGPLAGPIAFIIAVYLAYSSLGGLM